jgi:bifunctional enzyme CysN/CysC
MTVKSTHITATAHQVGEEARRRVNGHKGGVLWFTGLSGAGKSTLAFELEQRLFADGFQAYVLDGDNIRYGLSADLGFSHEDRTENVRRVGEVSGLFARAGIIVIAAFISPYRADREQARRAAGEGFHEIYLDASLEICESRDPKGLYAKARQGEVSDFTGVSAPYEAPDAPDLVVHTGVLGVSESLDTLLGYIEKAFVIAKIAKS